MNPEFQRNVWLEAGPQRLAWTAVALAAIYGGTLVLADRHHLQALGVAGAVVFVVTALLWGSRTAGRAVGDEVADRTWDFQRLSALDPWSMTWGKLFGATSLSWIAALSGLLFVCANALVEDRPSSALQVLIGGLAGAVLLRAGSMAMALVGVRRARAEGRSAAFRFTFGGVIAVFVIASVVGRIVPTAQLNGGRGLLGGLFRSGDVTWWGLVAPASWFTVASIAAFAGWALIAAWRLMRLELQMRNAPWAWPAFVVFAAVWAAGMAEAGVAKWAAAGLVFAACAYGGAFAEPADRVRLRRFGDLVARRRWGEAGYDVPAALAPLLLAAVAVIGVAVSPSDPRGQVTAGAALAALAFLVRDIGVVAFFRFGPRPRRGDFGAVIALFLAYFVGGVVGAFILVPYPPDPLPSAASGSIMAVVVWVLAWRRIRAPDRPAQAAHAR
jgi:hypothetical protein